MRNDTPEPENLAESDLAESSPVEPVETHGEAIAGGGSGVGSDGAGKRVRTMDGGSPGADGHSPGSVAHRDGEARAEETDILRRAQDGDRQALGQLVRRYQRRVFALGIRYFGNSDDAEDLVQDTFVRVWRGLDGFDLTRPFAPWLMRIAANRALTEIATRKRRAGTELDESMAWDGPGADEELERREMQRRVGRAINELPEDQRMILLLRVSDGMSYRDISDTLEIPIGTVMSRLSRAREAMRQKVQRH